VKDVAPLPDDQQGDAAAQQAAAWFAERIAPMRGEQRAALMRRAKVTFETRFPRWTMDVAEDRSGRVTCSERRR